MHCRRCQLQGPHRSPAVMSLLWFSVVPSISRPVPGWTAPLVLSVAAGRSVPTKAAVDVIRPLAVVSDAADRGGVCPGVVGDANQVTRLI